MRAIITATALLLLAAVAQAGELHPALADELASLAPDATTRVLVHMAETAPVAELDAELGARRASRAERHRVIVTALQAASASQAELKRRLDAGLRAGSVRGYRGHWIANLVVLTATRAEIEAVADRADVRWVEPDFEVERVAPVRGLRPAPGDREVGVTEGLVAIRAPEVWYELGYTGLTRLVGSLDTGVDGHHPALGARWRGLHAPWQECWLDVLDENTSFPLDRDGHGTHTCGTMAGAAPGDSIGVAWGAEWIACNAIDQSVSEDFDNDILAALEWFTDPDGDPGTVDDVPDVIQNSWGVGTHLGYESCFSLWWEVIDNCEAAGVATIWSAGNQGPNAGTIGSPADRAATLDNCFAVGAVDATNFDWPHPLADFSSRGPTTCEVPPGFEIKPELVAPGVDVYSSFPDGLYGLSDGTSMSGPHVAGVVALMRQADPNLDVPAIKQILMASARDEGDPGEDNDYGHGFLDAHAAVSQVIAGFGAVSGQVTNASWNDVPLPDVSLELLGYGWRFFTDANGEFSGRAAPGSYTLRASREGFASQDLPVLITAGGDVVQDIALSDVAGPVIFAVSEAITLPGGGVPEPISAEIVDYSTVAAATLHFSINGSSWNSEPMAWQTEDTYAGQLPALIPNTAVDYYVTAEDGLGQTSTNPAGAPGDFYTLLVTQEVYAYECEQPDFQWQLGVPGDDATNGLWVRADPVGTEQSGVQVQPEDDHTPEPGVACFVTGNGEPGGSAFANNVDNGCTTLQSPLFDLSGAERAFLNYWRWFANILVTADDEFAADISSDGGATWLPLERIPVNQNSWRNVFVDLGELIPLTAQVRLRFVICDLGLPSLLEAAVDDLRVETYTATTTAAGDWQPAAAAGALLRQSRNPWHVRDDALRIAFALDRAAAVDLSIYDIAGRLVRTLATGDHSAGEHVCAWDGRDERGRKASTGVYFTRLRADEQVRVRRTVLLR